MPIAASHDWDSPPDPYTRRASANSGRTASHTPTADAAAAARGANHTANSATRGVRATSKVASTIRTVPTAVATSIGEVGAHTATACDAATADACITVYQATPSVTGDTTKAAVGRPPDDGGATLDIKGGPGAEAPPQSATRPTQLTLPRPSPATPVGVRRRWGCWMTEARDPHRTQSPTIATKDSVADTRRERAAPRGSPGRLLRVLRGIGGPNCPSRQLHSRTPSAVLCRPPRQGGDTPTLPGVPSDRNIRRS